MLILKQHLFIDLTELLLKTVFCRKYRYTAYRQLIRWCYGYLGRQIRVVIPACAVHKIRDTFNSNQYHGFQLPILDD